ncbi:MAG: NADH-quinone oxidoreductase subunit F [Bacteroidetes bacterium 4572_77]|nr:MAG: NADH-quinone oxidoreductase subunit F [Bacteroidetes bacterium 4572_77]
MNKHEISICMGSSCFARGNKATLQKIKTYLQKHQLEEKVLFKGNRCFDQCGKGPNLMINGKMFHQVNAENVDTILDQFFSIFRIY